MNNKNDGGPAYPVKEWPTEIDKFRKVKSVKDYPGMSLRDYFAAKAMQGIINSARKHELVNLGHDLIAEVSYDIADAMLKERETCK